MELDINLYEIVYNGGLGSCHLLKKKQSKNGGFIYLFYSEENAEHYVVCEGIRNSKDSCYFELARYYSQIERALKAFEEMV